MEPSPGPGQDVALLSLGGLNTGPWADGEDRLPGGGVGGGERPGSGVPGFRRWLGGRAAPQSKAQLEDLAGGLDQRRGLGQCGLRDEPGLLKRRGSETFFHSANASPAEPCCVLATPRAAPGNHGEVHWTGLAWRGLGRQAQTAREPGLHQMATCPTEESHKMGRTGGWLGRRQVSLSKGGTRCPTGRAQTEHVLPLTALEARSPWLPASSLLPVLSPLPSSGRLNGDPR